MNTEAGPAIRALGSLFKLTEVYLWDDGSTEIIKICLDSQSLKLACEDDSSGSGISPTKTEFSQLVEDQELIKEMDTLGLPLAFQSNKEGRSKTSKNKRKGTRLKLSDDDKEFMDEEIEVMKVSGIENVSPSVLNASRRNSLCCVAMPSDGESYYCGVAVDVEPASEDSVVTTGIMHGTELETIEDLSNNSQECDLMSKDGTIRGTSSNNSDSASWVTDSQLNCEEELGGSFMECNRMIETGIVLRDEKDENLSDPIVTDHRSTVVSSQNLEVLTDGMLDAHECDDDQQDWMVYWDAFYMRNYFYNAKTGNSTWDLPPGMKNLAFHDFTDESNQETAKVAVMDRDPSDASGSLYYCDSIDETLKNTTLADLKSFETVRESGIDAHSNSIPSITIPTVDIILQLSGEHCGTMHSCDEGLSSNVPSEVEGHIQSFMGTITGEANSDGKIKAESLDPATGNLEMMLELTMKKKKKKARKLWILQQTRRRRKSSKATECLQCEDILENLPSNIEKYWCQRYHLFSRYDSGIIMDEEGWFSVTPELIAKHHALRCACAVLIDCFTGVGGNAIQFAQRCNHVIAIDIDPKKIGYAHHNAAIYGVNQIDFIIGDFFDLAPKLKADCVFLSPPWGGPDYARVKTYDINTMLKPHNGLFLFSIAKQIAHKVVMFLPRNVDLGQLAELSLSADRPWLLEVEKNFLNGKLKGITAYFSDTTVGN